MAKRIPDVIKVLRLGRKIVAKKWIQYRYGNAEIGFCALGAVHRAGCELNLPREGAISILDAAATSRYSDTVDYNDRRGRTQQQVIKLFDRAIAKAERKML